MMLWLLLQAAEPAAPPPDPLATLRGTVVEAIRNCGTAKAGEMLVCSPDRGYSERERRLVKLTKPKPVDDGSGIRIELSGTTTAPGAE